MENNNLQKQILISVENLIQKTSIDKIMKCYDFKKWEVEEVLSLENTSECSLNEFRWNYVLETLQLTQNISDIGQIAIDLIGDIQMGYHKVPHNVIYADIEGDDEALSKYDFDSLKFGFKPLVNKDTGKLEYIELFYMNDIDGALIDSEIKEVLEYLEIIQTKKNIEIY